MSQETSYLLSNRPGSKHLKSEDASVYGITPYGPAVAFAMALNYIIGTGCFGLPYAFQQSGIVLCGSLLLMGLAGALITMNYTLETLARVEGIYGATHGRGPLHRLTFRKFDFSMVGEMFSGTFGKYIVQLIMLLYGIGSLWSYASIFGSSMASLTVSQANISCNVYGDHPSEVCLRAYNISMVIYSILVISMVVMNLSEQAKIQKFLCLYRVLALLLMFITISLKLFADGVSLISYRYVRIGAFQWRNFGVGFGPTLLALNCHYNVPDILQPLYPKMYARDVIVSALIFSGVFYLLLGLLGALAFDHVNPLITLVWSDYTGCGNGWSPCNAGQKFPFDTASPTYSAIIIKSVILLFPVINVISTFPMVGVTIGDNLMASFSKKFTAALGPNTTRTISRVLVCVPPLMLAADFKRLEYIFSIAGVLGFLLGLTIPCWFQISGSFYCQRVWGFTGASITPYNLKFISSIKLAQIFFGLTILITFIAVLMLCRV